MDDAETKIVLSCEGFSHLDQAAVMRLRDLYMCKPLKILMYIRPYSEVIVSTYKQRTKNGRSLLNFDEFFERVHGTRLCFSWPVEQWGSVFGFENVHVRAIEPGGLIDDDLLTDFLIQIGVNSADLSQMVILNTRRRNISPGWKVTEFLRFLYGRQFSSTSRRGRVPKYMQRNVGLKTLSSLQAISNDVVSGEAGEYLTLEQRKKCDDAYLEWLGRIEALTGRPVRRLPSHGRAVGERRFLPDVAMLTELERDALMNTVRRYSSDAALIGDRT